MTRALTAFLIVGMTAMAPGAILWFPRQDIQIPTTFEGVSVDLETGNSSITAAGLPGGDVNFLLGGGAVTNDAARRFERRNRESVRPWLRIGPFQQVWC